MFGKLKKVNTIDELIIEYIKLYACKCNSNGNNIEIDLKEYANITYANDAINICIKVSLQNYFII